MPRSRNVFLITPIALLAVLFAMPASAQQNKPDVTTEEPPQFLHLSAIMAQQQMHHIKLWFAGDAGNWALADYEIDALKDGFDDVSKLVGEDLVGQHVGGAVSALKKSIDAKDHAAFVAAFDRLSAGCNACHRTLDHAFIVIKRPSLSPYSDQNFSPQK